MAVKQITQFILNDDKILFEINGYLMNIKKGSIFTHDVLEPSKYKVKKIKENINQLGVKRMIYIKPLYKKSIL